jgi:hypothetical protein
MATSLKKVIIRRWNQEWASGYLPPSSFIARQSVELLELGGKVLAVPLADLKWVCFVRDFNSGEIANPERLLRKTFSGRPRTAGLWIRLKLLDGDLLEGIAPNDATLVTSHGIFLVPPDTRSNTQRIFLPSSSISEFQVMSVIGISSRVALEHKTRNPKDSNTQPDLFSKP